MTTAKPKSILEAVLAVMSKVEYVQKTGVMRTGGSSYTYVEEAELIKALRSAMIETGLVLVPGEIVNITHSEYLTRNNNRMNHLSYTQRWVLHHAGSNETLEVFVPAEASDSSDKAAPKAATGSQKYALKQLFLIPTGDDPDKDNVERGKASGKQAPVESKDGSEGTKQKAATENKPTGDAAVMDKALAYKVPNDPKYMAKGVTFASLLNNAEMAVMLIPYFAGVEPDGEGALYLPQTEDEKHLSSAAKYIYDNNDTFKEHYKKFKESVS